MTERKPLPCIVCKTALGNLFDSPNQPSGGTAFASGGHYGSTVFDPMDGTQLEINVCDDCLKAAGASGEVLHYHFGSREPTLWVEFAQGIEAGTGETPQEARSEGRKPVPKDAPKGGDQRPSRAGM